MYNSFPNFTSISSFLVRFMFICAVSFVEILFFGEQTYCQLVSMVSNRVNFFLNKKVLLRERKRHTTCRVASARYADLSGGGHTLSKGWGEGGTLSHVQGGYPIPGLRGYPRYPPATLGMGYPPGQTWDGVPPPARPGMGYPPDLGWGTPPARLGMGYPPGQTWDGVPPSQTWDGVPPTRPRMGYPLPPPDLGWGTPSPHQTWNGIPPYLDLGWGTPPRKLNRHTPVKT